jgi:hypothetical protein
MKGLAWRSLWERWTLASWRRLLSIASFITLGIAALMRWEKEFVSVDKSTLFQLILVSLNVVSLSVSFEEAFAGNSRPVVRL